MSRIFTTLLVTLMLTAAARAKGELRHIVCFKFSDKATPEKVAMIETAFAELPSKIDAIQQFEWGTDVSKENKAKGFTHCFVVTFKDQAGLDTYLPHPAHKDFVTKLDGLIDDVFVIDYIAN